MVTDVTKNDGRFAALRLRLLQQKIETQTILQLLVKHGIVTREEVQETRDKVSKMPKYKEELDEVTKLIDQVSSNMEFEQIFSKMLSGSGSITDEEKDKFNKYMDAMYPTKKE
ncbi:MAG: hypothetical protein IKR19_08810 [Acholeplasmatales bacterium]|nr:hypothetical protein [Acholeplasmatales bacterium]